MEPTDLSSTDAMLSLLDLAVRAHAAGNLPEAYRLVRRLHDEPPPAFLAPFVKALGERWMKSFPPDVPPMTMVIVESNLEEAVDALMGNDPDTARTQLMEAVTYHPRTSTADRGILLFCRGYQAPPAARAMPATGPLASGQAPETPVPVAPAPPAAPASPAAPATPVPTVSAAQSVVPALNWLQQGIEALASDPASALGCFERACDREPHVAEAWAGKGRALLALGRPVEARVDLELAIKLAPGDAGIWDDYHAAIAASGPAGVPG